MEHSITSLIVHTTVISLALYIALLALGTLYSYIVEWVDDGASSTGNPVVTASEKLVLLFTPTPPSKLRDYYSRTDAEDIFVLEVSGRSSDYSDKDLTVEQRANLLANHPELFRARNPLVVVAIPIIIIAILILPSTVALAITVPVLAASLAGVVAIAFVARTSRRTYKKLKSHMADINAHKETK